jgi:predicted lipoprotein with Yx(FWY)xxD motif
LIHLNEWLREYFSRRLMMLHKIHWFTMFSMALIGALTVSVGISAAAPPAEFLKATDTGMSTPEATVMATEAPGAMSTSAPSGGGMLASPGVAVQEAANATLGNILTDSAGMTLYVFNHDTPGASNCTGTCAQNWPPLTVPADAMPTAGTGITGQLSVIPRSDGTYQVTYNDMPLYRFIGDKQPGDTNGQGLLNGAWTVALVTAAAPAAPAATAQPSEMQSTATPMPQPTP